MTAYPDTQDRPVWGKAAVKSIRTNPTASAPEGDEPNTEPSFLVPLNHWMHVARLLAVSAAQLSDIRDPRTLLDEYERRALRGERPPFGLWEDE